jgi:hypothetical protein
MTLHDVRDNLELLRRQAIPCPHSDVFIGSIRVVEWGEPNYFATARQVTNKSHDGGLVRRTVHYALKVTRVPEGARRTVVMQKQHCRALTVAGRSDGVHVSQVRRRHHQDVRTERVHATDQLRRGCGLSYNANVVFGCECAGHTDAKNFLMVG